LYESTAVFWQILFDLINKGVTQDIGRERDIVKIIKWKENHTISMRRLGLLELKITLVEKPDTILEFIRALKADKRISDEEELVLINAIYNEIPEFLSIKNEF